MGAVVVAVGSVVVIGGAVVVVCCVVVLDGVEVGLWEVVAVVVVVLGLAVVVCLLELGVVTAVPVSGTAAVVSVARAFGAAANTTAATSGRQAIVTSRGRRPGIIIPSSRVLARARDWNRSRAPGSPR
ncbi:hypothetical protein V5P93_003581 [Actinokineospora auranticolor]|uniref:hypothetical protein n=1 Tax=Actinokineospora auranticolor TaxID=155976 RepID=UPI0015E3C8BB|nr:hypothetical protein [Actinokineospora auranticolor]